MKEKRAAQEGRESAAAPEVAPEEKERRLLALLAACGSAAVAFSGGTDSAYLLYAARRALGDRAVAVTVRTPAVEREELEAAEELCRRLGVRQLWCDFDALALPAFAENGPERCYHCKRAIFSRVLARAEAEGLAVVAEGSNVDDLGDYRPGLRALAELGVRSPLWEAGLTKREIRLLSRAAGLPTWEKPSAPCLATRIPYGERITAEKLRRVGEGERVLHALGFRQVRVRLHGELARIEAPAEELPRLITLRERVEPALRALGFRYVTADLRGFRSGSMNEALGRAAAEP